MFYDRDPWSDWPYGAYEPERAREIRELMEVVSDHEEAADPDTLIYYEPPDIDEELVESLEEALGQITREVESLEARLEHAREAERRLACHVFLTPTADLYGTGHRLRYVSLCSTRAPMWDSAGSQHRVGRQAFSPPLLEAIPLHDKASFSG